MKQRVEASESYSDGQCEKHPFSSPIGVCAFCLNEKLVQLQRSNLSLYRHRNSISTVEFDCVSIIEEHEKQLRRSNSSCRVEGRRVNGLWRIRDFFGRMIKKNKWGEKSDFGFSEGQSGISVDDKVGSSKIYDSGDFYGSNRLELCGIYENYWVPERSDFRVEESDFCKTESDDFIDLKLDLL